MKCLVLLTVLGLAYAQGPPRDTGNFKCDDDKLLKKPIANEASLINNQETSHFSINVETADGNMTNEYEPGMTLLVKLAVYSYPRDDQKSFKRFMIVARRLATNTPVGQWLPLGPGFRPLSQEFQVVSCGGVPNSALYMSENTPGQQRTSVVLSYIPPNQPNIDSFEFVATVEDAAGDLIHHVMSIEVSKAEPKHNPHEGEDRLVDAHDVHKSSREFSEDEQDDDDEVEGGPNNDDEEESVDDADKEDPNAEERAQESERKNADFRDTHGVVEEERATAEWEKHMNEMLQQELEEGEGDWVKEEMERERQDEEDRHQEMMQYERIMAEDEKKRMEIIEWEIKDKEEHDRIMWEEEQKKIAEEKEANKTPKDDEIRVDEEIIIVEKPAYGAAAGAASNTASCLILLSTVVYMLL